MSLATVNRRLLLRWGLSTSVLASLPLGSFRIARSAETILLESVSSSELPIREARTGKLSREDFGTISGVCDFVRTGWALSFDIDTYLRRLQSDLAVKTGETPSYLSEYESAAALVRELAAVDPEGIWPTLLFSEFADDDLAPTRLGRARRFVFSEIIAHMVPITGSFREFGLINYAGYIGGPYAHPGSYRRLGSP